MKTHQRRFIAILCVICLFLLLLFEFFKQNSVPSPNQTTQSIIPLAIGNSWTYLGTSYDTSGSIQDHFEEIHAISGDTVLFGKRCFIYNQFFYANSDSGLIIYGGYSWSSESPRDTFPSFYLLYKYPTHQGDSFGHAMEVVAIDTLIRVRAGEFKCIEYESFLSGFLEADFYLSPNLGLVKSDRFYNNLYHNSPLRIRDCIELSLFKQPTVYDSTYIPFDSLKNALIHDEDFGWVRLKNGEYSVNDSDSQIGDIRYVGDFAFVDLDNDGYKDAIGTLSTNTGGSGCFISMVIFLNRNGSPIFTDSYFIGDREGIDSVKFDGRRIHVFLKIHGPNDPMCCPSLPIEKNFDFTNDRLKEIK